jgi:hypothetical protein
MGVRPSRRVSDRRLKKRVAKIPRAIGAACWALIVAGWYGIQSAFLLWWVLVMAVTTVAVLRSCIPDAVNGTRNLTRGVAVRHGYSLPRDMDRLRGSALEATVAYRPVLRFDSSERWRPLRIDDWFTREPAIQLCLQNECAHVSSSNALFDSPLARRAAVEHRMSDLRIDIPGRRARDYEPHDGLACGTGVSRFECDGAPRSAIYVTVSHVRTLYYFDYWWFLRFNDFPRTHWLSSPPVVCRP